MIGCVQDASGQQEQQEEQSLQTVPYKLYPTNNMWTFIKLDTRNGKMWQVQYSIENNDYRFEIPLNAVALASSNTVAGRYELYPTQNMFNFILLDGVEGKTWQVQWSTNVENQAIIPISK